MIVEFILSGFQSVVTTILGVLPNIPAMPSAIQDSVDGFVLTISQIVGVISYLYTPPIFIFLFTVLIAVLNFDWIYRLALWVLHKVRG